MKKRARPGPRKSLFRHPGGYARSARREPDPDPYRPLTKFGAIHGGCTCLFMALVWLFIIGTIFADAPPITSPDQVFGFLLALATVLVPLAAALRFFQRARHVRPEDQQYLGTFNGKDYYIRQREIRPDEWFVELID